MGKTARSTVWRAAAAGAMTRSWTPRCQQEHDLQARTGADGQRPSRAVGVRARDPAALDEGRLGAAAVRPVRAIVVAAARCVPFRVPFAVYEARSISSPDRGQSRESSRESPPHWCSVWSSWCPSWSSRHRVYWRPLAGDDEHRWAAVLPSGTAHATRRRRWWWSAPPSSPQSRASPPGSVLPPVRCSDPASAPSAVHSGAHTPVRELSNSSPHTTAKAGARRLREPAISNFWQVRPCTGPEGRVFRLRASA